MSGELLKPIESKLAALMQHAQAIQVVDKDTYAAACQIVVSARKEIKAIGFVLDPGIASAKEHLDELREQKAAFIANVQPIVDLASGKAEAWKAEERRKAEAEAERINAERRREAARIAEEERKAAEAKAEEERRKMALEIAKARRAGELEKAEADRLAKENAEKAAQAKALAAKQAQEAALHVPEAKVKPAVPVVQGIRARVNWKFRVVDSSRIPRSYLMPDEVAIGQEVRRLKDKTAAEAAIPGIEVYAEDSI